MKKQKNVVINNKVILNLIQDLQHLPLLFINDLRGRLQIKFAMTSLYNNGGFTLIELLVVVLIIGILAAVALPQYNKAVMKSRAVQALLFMRNAGQALDRWVLENGTPNESGLYFTGTSATQQLDVDLTSGMTCTATECSDGTFTYTSAWEGFYWHAGVGFEDYNSAESGAYFYTETEPKTSYVVKVCTSYDDEGARLCAALCSLDSGFC